MLSTSYSSNCLESAALFALNQRTSLDCRRPTQLTRYVRYRPKVLWPRLSAPTIEKRVAYTAMWFLVDSRTQITTLK
jgi:hypothetical protein